MNIKRLFEEFLTTIKVKTKTKKSEILEIFVNPTRKEIQEFIRVDNAFKFIASNRKKKIYIFSSWLIHTIASKIIDKEFGTSLYKNLNRMSNLGGVATKKGNKYIILSIHNVGALDLFKVKKWARKNWNKWRWLEKYNIVVELEK